jgi:hypothetical protein
MRISLGVAACLYKIAHLVEWYTAKLIVCPGCSDEGKLYDLHRKSDFQRIGGGPAGPPIISRGGVDVPERRAIAAAIDRGWPHQVAVRSIAA